MMLQNRVRNEAGNNPPVAGWPTLQQAHQQPDQCQPGTGMRAVFLGNPNPKRESTGTGVFLPRQPEAPTQPVKKRGCSTVLLPNRVVRALDLKLEAIGGESKLQSRCNAGSHASDYDAEIHRQQQAAMSELRLPQEWTY